MGQIWRADAEAEAEMIMPLERLRLINPYGRLQCALKWHKIDGIMCDDDGRATRLD